MNPKQISSQNDKNSTQITKLRNLFIFYSKMFSQPWEQGKNDFLILIF